MPRPIRLVLKSPIGKTFFKSCPFEEAYFRDQALVFRATLSMPLVFLAA